MRVQRSQRVQPSNIDFSVTDCQSFTDKTQTFVNCRKSVPVDEDKKTFIKIVDFCCCLKFFFTLNPPLSGVVGGTGYKKYRTTKL